MNGSDYLCTHYTRCLCRNQSWNRGPPPPLQSILAALSLAVRLSSSFSVSHNGGRLCLKMSKMLQDDSPALASLP